MRTKVDDRCFKFLTNKTEQIHFVDSGRTVFWGSAEGIQRFCVFASWFEKNASACTAEVVDVRRKGRRGKVTSYRRAANALI